MVPQQTTNESSTASSTPPPPSNVWVYWILANTIGHVAGISAFGILSLFISWTGADAGAGSVMDLALPFAVLGLLDGLLVGLAQGLVLKHFTGRALLGEWAVFTALGGIAAWVLGPMLGGMTIFIIGVLFYVVAGGIAGLVLGYAQRPTVLRQIDPEASWIMPNMLAGAVAVTVAVAFSSLWGSADNPGGIMAGVELAILSIGIGGLVYGAVTARSVARMLDYYAARTRYGSEEPREDMSKLPAR